MEKNKKQLGKRLNKRLKIIQIFFLILIFGAILNLTAVHSNGGKMPVYNILEVSGDRHFPFYDKEDVNFFYLTDVFYFYSIFFSVGDVILWSSLLIILTLNVISFVDAFKFRRRKKWQSP